MDTEQFLASLFGTEPAHLCLLGIQSDGPNLQSFHTCVEDLASAGRALDVRGIDTYFGVACYASNESRRADNVESLPALFLDLDCAEGKGFTDKADALRQLRDFCDTVELPKPMVVDSGGGLHIYWPLTEPADREQWRITSRLLRTVCEDKKFHADHAVTTDSARVLRLPGTHNYKYGEPREVHVLMEAAPPASIEFIGAKLLAASEGEGSQTSLPFELPKIPEGASSDAALQHLMGSRSSSFRRIIERTASGSGCAQLEYIIRNREGMSEPLWRAGLSIATHCEDRDKAIHVVSKGHPGYDPYETEKKAEHVKGPYLCEKFDELNPGLCDGCQNAGKVKSPIVLGQYVQEADESEPPTLVHKASPTQPANGVPAYPKPFFRAKGGGVYIRVRNEDGDQEDKLVYRYDMYVIRRVRDPEQGESLVFRVHFPMDGISEFSLPLTALSSRDELRKSMSKEGVLTPNWDVLLRYVMAWVDELQVTVAADKARRQFGWVDDNCTSFVLGEMEVFADRIEYNPPSATTASLFPEFEARGTLEGWKENMEFYNRPGMELHQLVQVISFGSVLMHSSPVNCAALHIWSKDSGFGKSTAFYSALSAWGRPKGLVLGKLDTLNAKMHRADVYHNLPLALDEITNMAGAELSQLAYQFTGGQQKDRMVSGANQTRYRGREWKLLAVTNANTPFVERIAKAKALPKAEAQRVLEVKVDMFFDGTDTKHLTDAFASNIEKHYGHAGPAFIQFYLQNREKIDQLLVDTQRRLDAAAGLTAQNRFWSELASKAMTAAIVLKRMGFINWDLKRLTDFVVTVLKQNKSDAESLDIGPMEFIVDYFNDNYGNFLQIKSTDDLRGHAMNGGMEQLVVPEFQPRVRIYGRYEPDTCKLFLVTTPFREWCSERQVSFNQLKTELQDKHGAKIRKARITKGTPIKMPPQTTLIIPIPPEIGEHLSSDDTPPELSGVLVP